MTESDDHSSRHADDHSQEVVQPGEGVNLNNNVSDQSISKVTSAPTTAQSESTASPRIFNNSTGPSTSALLQRENQQNHQTPKMFQKGERIMLSKK